MGGEMERTLWAICGLLLVYGLIMELTSQAFAFVKDERALSVDIKGEIILVEAEKSKLVIKCFMDEHRTPQRFVFYANKDTVIRKEGQEIGISGLLVGETVMLEYSQDQSGKKIINSLTVVKQVKGMENKQNRHNYSFTRATEK